MKKIVSIVLTLCICCGWITGCKKEVKVSSDFDTETNQNERIKECHYQVPDTWTKEGNVGDTTMFYYPDNGMLMVYYEDSEESILGNGIAQTYMDNFTSGWDNVKLEDAKTLDISGGKAYSQEWEFETEDTSYVSKTILFDCGDGIMNFTMNTEKGSDVSYAEDFNEVLNSVQVYLPFQRTISDFEETINILKIGGKNNFISSGVDILDDGTTMETFVDSSNETQLTLIGDENENVTHIHASAKDETGMVSVSTLVLMGADVLSTRASEFLTDLAPENLVEMKSGSENSKIETIDGVSYMISKMDSSTYLYSFDLQRDNATKEDYEAYLAK